MTSRNARFLRNERSLPSTIKLGVATSLLAGLVVLPGCKKKAPPPPPPPPPPKATEPEWQLVSESLGLPSNVIVENAEYVGCSEEQMRASFMFVDAFAQGNDERLSSMITPQMRNVLDTLIDNEEWQESTESIRSIEMISCESETPSTVQIVFAIQADGDIGNDTQTWSGVTRGSSILFAADYELEEVLSADANIHISAARMTLGRAAFETGRCARCHGDNGGGDNNGPNLTDSQWTHSSGSIQGILQVLENGIAEEDIVDDRFRRKMDPATSRISNDDELLALAQYVWALSHPDQSDDPDGSGDDGGGSDDGNDNGPKGKPRPGNPPSSPGGPG